MGWQLALSILVSGNEVTRKFFGLQVADELCPCKPFPYLLLFDGIGLSDRNGQGALAPGAFALEVAHVEHVHARRIALSLDHLICHFVRDVFLLGALLLLS